MKTKKTIKTIVRNAKGVLLAEMNVDVELGKGGGLNGSWVFGWSYLLGGLILKYEDGQVITARSSELFATMTSLHKKVSK